MMLAWENAALRRVPRLAHPVSGHGRGCVFFRGFFCSDGFLQGRSAPPPSSSLQITIQHFKLQATSHTRAKEGLRVCEPKIQRGLSFHGAER